MKISPLNARASITDAQGRPTPYFMDWAYRMWQRTGGQENAIGNDGTMAPIMPQTPEQYDFQPIMTFSQEYEYPPVQIVVHETHDFQPVQIMQTNELDYLVYG